MQEGFFFPSLWASLDFHRRLYRPWEFGSGSNEQRYTNLPPSCPELHPDSDMWYKNIQLNHFEQTCLSIAVLHHPELSHSDETTPSFVFTRDQTILRTKPPPQLKQIRFVSYIIVCSYQSARSPRFLTRRQNDELRVLFGRRVALIRQTSDLL